MILELRFLSRLFLFLVLVFGYSVYVVRAHGGGTPQLTNVDAGPYRLFVWTQPATLRVGESHFTIAVSEPSDLEATQGEAGNPVLDATVTVQVQPVDQPEKILNIPATRKNSTNKLFYEADLELPATGQWLVIVSVEGPAGSGRADFEIEILESPSNSGWILFGGVVLVLTFAWAIQTHKKGTTLKYIIAVVASISIVATITVNWLNSVAIQGPPVSAETAPVNWYYWKNLLGSNKDDLVIEVVASQWTWQFNYPQVGISSTDLNMPQGRTVLLEMTSTDIIHSFWLPEFQMKQDVMPGRHRQSQVTPIKLGTYKIECATVCGLDYDNMGATVNVMNPTDFEAWLTDQQNTNTND